MKGYALKENTVLLYMIRPDFARYDKKISVKIPEKMKKLKKPVKKL